MKKRAFIVTPLICVLAIAGGVVESKSLRQDVEYTDSVNPDNCLHPAGLPSGCTTFNTGIMCSATLPGGVTRKYFQGSGCVVPYYRLP